MKFYTYKRMTERFIETLEMGQEITTEDLINYAKTKFKKEFGSQKASNLLDGCLLCMSCPPSIPPRKWRRVA